MRITSRRNPLVQFVRSLAQPTERRAQGVYVIEGVRLVWEAIGTGQRATLALYDPDVLRRSPTGAALIDALPRWAEATAEVDVPVLEAAAQTTTPAGVVAVLAYPQWQPLAIHGEARFGLILDRVSDPGNAGTILRTADAFACAYVATTPGTTDLFAPKVVRAGMGAHFRLPLYQHLQWSVIRSSLPAAVLVAAEAQGGTAVQRYSWPPCTALVVGSEAEGLSPEAVEGITQFVSIPMRLGVESLNAGVAASILLFSVAGSRVGD